MGDQDICKGSRLSLSSDENVFQMDEAASKRGRSSSEETTGRTPDENQKKKSKTLEDLTGRVTGLIRKFSNKASIEASDEEEIEEHPMVKPIDPPMIPVSAGPTANEAQIPTPIMVEMHHVPKERMLENKNEKDDRNDSADEEEGESEEEGNTSGEDEEESGESENEEATDHLAPQQETNEREEQMDGVWEDPNPGGVTIGGRDDQSNLEKEADDNDKVEGTSQRGGFRPGYENRKKDKTNHAKQDKKNERNNRGYIKRNEQSQERDPTLLRFPVIIEEIGSTKRLAKMSPHTVTSALNTQSRLPISRYKVLNSGKLVVECTGPRQQTALSHCDQLAGVSVKCRIPTPTVEGVIRCLGFDEEEWTLIQKQSRRQNEIAYIQRLKNKHGELTSAAKVVFNSKNLPQEVIIGSQIFDVEPYNPPVRRCNKCQKLGHTRKFCIGKNEICTRCGRSGHEARVCRDTPRCVNCCGQHYSSAVECPAARVWKRATQNRAKNYVPFSVAYRTAKKEIEEENKTEKEKDSAQSIQHIPTVKVSYAGALKNTQKGKTQQPQQKQTNAPGTNTKVLLVELDNTINQQDPAEVNKPKHRRAASPPPLQFPEMDENIVEGEINNMRRELTAKHTVAGLKNKAKPDTENTWSMAPDPKYMTQSKEVDTLQSAQQLAEMNGPVKEGTRILFALGHYRRDGDVNKLLAEIFHPEPPPRRTILLECLLVAAGILSERSPDSDKLPVF